MIRIYAGLAIDPGQRIGSMSASDAQKLLKTYTYFTPDPLSPSEKGYQRPANVTRFAAIARDMEIHGVTPLIISDRGRWGCLFRSVDSAIEMEVDEFIASIQAVNGITEEFCASIIDGQHRFEGSQNCLRRNIDVEVPFLLYTGLDWAAEVERFNTINTTAKNLPRALVEVNKYTAFDPETADSREALQQQVREVVMALETDEDSIWHNQVNMTGGRNSDRPVTFEGLRRSTEATFDGRLRMLPLNKKKEFAKTYWKIVAETWPDAWNNVPETRERVNPMTGEIEPVEQSVKYRIKDLVGVSAIARIGNDVLQEAYDADRDVLNTGTVRARLNRAKNLSWVKSDDNPDMNSQAGMAGSGGMYQMLLSRIY